MRVFVCAAAAALIATTGADAMTCNIARPYNAQNLSRAIPGYSRTRPDMLFKKGDTVEIFVFPKSRPLDCSWQVSRNMVEKPFLSGEGEPCPDQSVRIVVPSARLAPGFYDVKFVVRATAKEKEEGRAAFGWEVDRIVFADSRPADFAKFWADAKAKAYAVPLNAAETFVREMDDAEISRYNVESASIPEEYDPAGKKASSIRVYKVQFDSYGGRRMHGWLAVPAGKGPFPGMLVLPGAGCAKLPIPAEHARHGYAALMLHVHGMDVDLEKYETPKGYLAYGRAGFAEKPEDDYYYGVYLACAQAVRYLASRPDVDAKRLAVAGASQGGLLSIVTAGLCPEVRAVVSSLCYYAGFPFRDHAAALNREKRDGTDVPTPPFDPKDPRQRHMGYYDAANFAPAIKAPTIMAASLCDTPSPVTTVWEVFRRLGAAKKEIQISPGTNHDLFFSFERAAWRWLDAALGR